MNRDWDDLVGVLVVRDQAHLVDMTLRSAAPVVDRFHVIDNGSTDGTVEVIERTADEADLELHLEEQTGYAGRLFLDAMQEYRGDYVFRLEGDQVYWPAQLEKAIKNADRKTNVACHVFMLRNLCWLQNALHPTNAGHPTFYPVDGSNRMIDGRLWPRSPEHRSLTPLLPLDGYEGNHRHALIGVNCKVLPAAERAKRWHRPTWWRWGNRDVPWYFQLDDVEMPYQESMSLETYIWRLQDEGKGAAVTKWGQDRRFETLAEMGEALVAWDIRNNCQFYAGPYPPILEARIDRLGYGLGVFRDAADPRTGTMARHR